MLSVKEFWKDWPSLSCKYSGATSTNGRFIKIWIELYQTSFTVAIW